MVTVVAWNFQKYFIYAKQLSVGCLDLSDAVFPAFCRQAVPGTEPRDTNRMRISIKRSVSARCLARKEVSRIPEICAK